MRRFFAIFATCLAAVLSIPTAYCQQAEVIDGVAAIVNDEVITFSQVRELIGARERAMREAYRTTALAALLAPALSPRGTESTTPAAKAEAC